MQALSYIEPTQPLPEVMDGFMMRPRHVRIVQAMLELRPALLPIIKVLPELVARHFPGSQLSLSPGSDDDGTTWTHLVVEVMTHLPAEVMLEAQDAFEDVWWDEQALSHFRHLRLLVRTNHEPIIK